MKLFTFTAEDSATAMQMAVDALGEDAIIVSNNKDGKNVRIIAAVDRDFQPMPTAKPAVDQKALQKKIAHILKFHKIPGKIADEMLENLSGRKLADEHDALEQMLGAYFKYNPIDSSKNQTIMLFGLPGIGKTLAISKLMAQAVFHDLDVNVITTDIKRAGGVEQLTAFTKILKLKLHVARDAAELKKVLASLDGGTTLIDTSGMNQYEQSEIDGLHELLEGNDEIEPVLVQPAGGDVEEAVEMAKAFRHFGAKRMIITKADSARRFGSILTVARIMKLHFANFSGTPSVAKTLEGISAEALAEILTVSG